MEFVRHVLTEAGSPLADQVTGAPIDGLPTGPALASSLAGHDLGPMADRIGELQPGDIVFEANTYGSWPAGTITHVGIYIGGGYMVHRPTSDRPVEEASLNYGWHSYHFRAALRPQAPGPARLVPVPEPKATLKIAGHDDRLSGIWGDAPARALDSLHLQADWTDHTGAKQVLDLHCHSGLRRIRLTAPIRAGEWIDLDSLTVRADYRP